LAIAEVKTGFASGVGDVMPLQEVTRMMGRRLQFLTLWAPQDKELCDPS
jgi:hypothetical protein